MYSRTPKGDEGTVEIQMAMYNSRGEKNVIIRGK